MSTTRDGPSVFRSFKLGDLTLRNRVVRSGCCEGLSPGGEVTDHLIEHHRRVTGVRCALSEDHPPAASGRL